MEIDEIKSFWKSYDNKLDALININLHCLNQIQAQKVRSNLSPLLWQRIVETVFHGTALALLLAFLYKYHTLFPYAVSAIMLTGFYMMLFVNSFRQIQIIRNINYGSDILSIQSALATLRTHSVSFMRLIFLFLPAVFAYPMVVSKVIQDFNLTSLRFMDIESQFKGDWWRAQSIATVIWTPVAIWLYSKVSYKNISIPWVRKIIEKAVGKRVAKAAEYLKELNVLKNEKIGPMT